MEFLFDVIVIGAGHAGCEAASAAANLGSKTLLITMDMNKIAQMSCNPAVGGIAKGQIVREIDAMCGMMGLVTDATAIQFRMLNRSKGPAMWSPRSQSDRQQFIIQWREILDSTKNLHIWQDTVTQFIVENGEFCGVVTSLGVVFRAKSCVLTSGTFLNGLLHIGKTQVAGGRISEPASYGLTEQLKTLGFITDRMKTGTPVRINGNTIDFSAMGEQQGDQDFHKFSYLERSHRVLQQRSCWITYTNNEVHDILRQSLADSPLYNGQIQSIGPRYCPSIETKIVTFADKDRHQLFLEPEGENTQEYYLNGFSSSLPIEVQYNALHKIPGLEKAEIYRPGYAIEYDFFIPTQLHHTLETKLVKNLFFAGQINGTTGYEEAAGQGLVAGINAHINVHGGNPFILNRDEAYIGVLIDDLVTKGVDEPYRMFTSRAEYRILLRQDNADQRLTERANELGLVSQERIDTYRRKQTTIDRIVELLRETAIKPIVINGLLESLGSNTLQHSDRLYNILLRPQISLAHLLPFAPGVNELLSNLSDCMREEIIEEVEITVKYSGYISREREIADKLNRLEHINLSPDFDYNALQSLSTEARQKLTKIKPRTIGQASRIPGVSPSDINVLLVLLGR